MNFRIALIALCACTFSLAQTNLAHTVYVESNG